MNLRDFLNRDGKTSELYWALVIEPGWVQSAIWQISDEKAQIIATSPTTAWETDEELIEASDASLSAAAQNLPEDSHEPEKTVFGVSPSWVSGGQIKDEFLEKIKKVCAELSLIPSGFVVLPEAISHLFKSEEGTPVTAIVLGVSKENLELTLFRLGNLVGTTSVARSVSIFEDVIEGLTRFGSTDPLPSRIVIYDGRDGELEDLKQELIKSDWSEIEKVKFLHTPKVEILETEKKVVAVALAGAAEIGHVTSVVEEKKEDFADTPSEEPDITAETNIHEAEGEINPNEVGFVVGGDVSKSVPGPQVAPPTPHIANLRSSTPLSIPAKSLFSKISSFFGKFTHFAKSSVRSIPLKSRPNFLGGRKLLFIPILGVLILLFLAWIFYPKATVTIFVAPQTLRDSFNVTVDPSLETSDLGNNQLKAEVVEVEVSGEKTQPTSGKKTIGDKAKGNVKIRNGTSSTVNLGAGAILVSSTGLEFITDKSASISAALSPETPGTATLDATAANIGSEYNLGKDETFKVGNYPRADVDGIANAQFSGGTSKEIAAVSDDDQDSLLEKLTDELSAQAEGELKNKISSDKYFLDGSIESSSQSTTFSDRVGDEAGSLGLDLELTASGLVVDKAQIYELAESKLKGNVPGGYVLRAEQLNLGFDFVDNTDGVYEFETKVEANLLPEIKLEEIAKKIAGKSPTRTEEFLRTIPGFARAEIKFTKSLPLFPKVIPRINKNIDVEIAAEQ